MRGRSDGQEFTGLAV